jgi:D-tyrosyl-tRNA(Tyr) deacylase
VEVDQNIIGKIDNGFLVLIGVGQEDNREIADKLVKKLVGLRIFEDENGKTNLSLADVNGELLLISQFTLYANCKKGFRPSFTDSGSPDMAKELYEYIIEKCREVVPSVQTGSFGADMKVQLVNDGPFTIILDSETL